MHHPGPPRFTAVGSAVDLAPRDPDPDGEYHWRVIDAPEESQVALGADPVVELVPDEAGTYVVELDAPDGIHQLTVRAFPAASAPPKPGPDLGGDDPETGAGETNADVQPSDAGSGSRAGSGTGPRVGGEVGSGSGAVGVPSATASAGNHRPRLQLFGHVDGDEVVLTTSIDLSADADPETDVRVEFYADDRDPLDAADLTVEGTDARIPVGAVEEYSRVHAVAVDETYSVADTVAISGGETVAVDRLNDPPAWSRDASIYEIYVRTFTDDEDATFDAMADRLPYLSDLGVDCIWLTPVLQHDGFDHGYNITDFFSIAEDLGTRKEFEAFVDAAHDHGISVLFDLVLNHSAREHPYFKHAVEGNPEYRDWYEWEDESADAPATYFDWPYIANFDFGSLQVRRHLLDAVDEWAAVVDGFRCDMAWAVPTGFWKEIRERVKQRDADFLLLDETIPYAADFHELCFDVHFDTHLYSALREIGHGTRDANAIHDAMAERAAAGFPDHAAFLQYVENHDEIRYKEECGRDAAFAAAGAIATLPGIPLVYAGQEFGEDTKRERLDWANADEDLREHYRSLLATREEHPALGSRGEYEPVDAIAGSGVTAFAREQDDERYVVVLNFEPGAATVSFPAERTETTNLLDGTDLGAEDGDLTVDDVAIVSAEQGVTATGADIVGTTDERSPATMNQEWYKQAVVYTLDVKTFNDSDGDGWGDFQGVIERLEYIDDLGVDCLWLRPFYPSPLRDNGYDVADYYDVDDRLGTLEDFRELCDRAHDRGIRVLTDLVFNHTSVDHEWFQAAREDPDSKYHDYYLWTDDVESAYSTINIFPDVEDGVWTYDDVAGKHYFHQFYSHQPDLDVGNPAVRDEIRDVLRFWLEQGADGFRIDAAHPMVQQKGHDGQTLGEDPIWLFKEMHQTVRNVKDDAILLAEADDQPEELRYYFGDGEAFDMLFNFVLNAHLTYAIGVKDTWPLYRAEERLPDISDVGHWATFLRNHDEWNLLKLPQEAFEHAREYFGDEEGDSWIFGRGHRLRLADLYDGDPDRIAMAHSLLCSLPGTPVIMSGDEIGMEADLSLPEREAVRTPMQWDGSENAGFSTADQSSFHNPIASNGKHSSDRVNVADQRGDPGSLLSRVQRAVAAHQECPEINAGTYNIVHSDYDDVFVHRIDHPEAVIACGHNFADGHRETACGVDLPADATRHVVGDGDYRIEDGRLVFDLDPYEYVWLKASAAEN